MDENSCIQEIQKLISTYRSSWPKLWIDICVKTEEYLQESSIKQKLALLDVVSKWVSLLVKRDNLSSESEELLLPLTSIWCKIYFSSLKNLKLCQKVRKTFNTLCEINHHYAKCEIKRNIKELLLSTSKIVNAIEIVCQLIDVFELGRVCVEELFESFITTISQCLDSFCQQYCVEKLSKSEGLLSNSDMTCQIIVKAVLKMFQYFPSKTGSLLYSNTIESSEDTTVMEAVISNLWRILFCKTLAKECIFLCGTATGLLLGIATDHKLCTSIKQTISQLLIASGAVFIQCQAVEHHHSVMIGYLKLNLPSPEYKPITQLAIVLGIIKSYNEQILLEIEDGEQTTLMEGLLFQTTYTLCRESKNSPVHYVAFEAMKQWVLCIKIIFKKRPFYERDIWMTQLESCHVSHLIDLIWENLEDPIDGVPGLAVTLFGLLLEWHKDEEIARNSLDEQFYMLLMDKVLGFPWHVKGRYGLLCSLLKYVGLQQIMQHQPTILDDLIHCLGVNQLTSSSASTLRAFLDWGRNNQVKEQPMQKATTEFKKQWEKSWKAALFIALTNKDRLLQQNACVYWLPCVLKCVPEYLSSLLKQLRDACYKDADRSRVFLAYLSVLKVSRSLALLRTEDLDEVPLNEGLTHLHDDIRATALSVISFTPKTAEPLSTMEQKLLKDFLPYNLNTACAPFRQTLFVSMKKILGRVRDSSLILLKEHHPFPDQREKDSVLPHSVDGMLKFVDWLFKLVMGCFFPGASYQRHKTGMQLLVAILEVFSVKWQPDKRKGQPPASCHLLVSLANRHGYFEFFSIRSAVILFGCVESPYADIRDAAVYILREHFSWPLILLENDSTGRASARMVVQKAVALGKSPKVQDCQSAAVLFQLIHTKYVSKLGWEFNFSTKDIRPPSPPDSRKSSGGGKLCCTAQMLHELLAELKEHVKAAQKDMKLASQNKPGHGISLAMAHCVEVTCLDISKESLSELQTVIQHTVDTAIHIIIFMMDLLSGTNSMDAIGGASFADIGEALDEIVSLSMTNNDEEMNEVFSVDSHKDMVISCCWLNIKCACYLLAVIFEKTTIQLKQMPTIPLVDEETLKTVAETTWKVIMQCRHQGVVQNCRSSFTKICQCLFHSSQPCLHSLPSKWLDDMLDTVSSSSSQTSVTRRSAGLPVLFSCILSCEPTSGQRLLLKQCMKSLLDTASLPLPAVIDQHIDLPQVHAINIVKSLYQDTSLGCDVLEYASQGTIMAISGFASSSWAVRNASMQLLGSLVKRMLGQRRGADDDTEINTINATDFFNSYPALRMFFLTHLQNASQSAYSSSQLLKMSKPELFPILTFLSKLHPYSKANESSSSLLSEFVLHLVPLSSSPSYTERVVAAKALVPFIPAEHVLDKVEELVKLLPGPEPARLFSQNVLHGTLLQIGALLEVVTWSTVKEKGRGLLKEILKKTWICSLRNYCPLTRAAFLSIVMKFQTLLLNDSDHDFNLLQSIVMDSLSGSTAEANHPLLGEAQWQRTLVRACLHFEFYNPAKEQKSQLSQLMSSTHKERRLAALEYFSNESCQIPSSIHVELVTLLIDETDHCCLVSALELFIRVFLELDMCLLPSADMKILWNKLKSLAWKSSGVTVAGKAIPACSVVIKYIMNMTNKQTISVELQGMLEQWRELIQTNCDWQQDELLRLGTVQSLRFCGVTVLRLVLTTTEGSGLLKHSCLVETSTSVLSSTLCALQDEEEQIRLKAAEFVAMVTKPARSVTCSAAMERVLQLMVEHFWSIPGCWVTMETMIRGLKSTEDVLRDYLRARHMLFEQEDANLYAEPVMLATMVVKHFKLIISQLLGSSETDARDDFLHWFVGGCDRLTNDLRALRDSGIKDCGFLANPKPFIVRFRVMCMAEVLWFAVNSGLRSESCLSVINAVKTLLVNMLEEIIQVKDAVVHPWLTECVSDLLIIVRKPDDFNSMLQ